MVRAWYMDEDKTSDQRLEHHQTPAKYISMDDLKKDTGVEYFQVRNKKLPNLRISKYNNF